MGTSAHELCGRRIGRYTLVEYMISGGMAEIFRARHEAPGGFVRDFALKILQSRYAGDAAVVEMFRSEARLAARLNHPNIVDVHEVGEDGGLHFIAMEYIAGRTLTDVVRRAIEVSQPFHLDVATHVVAETAAGMAYMHDGRPAEGGAFGIVHRDISPSNLMLSLSGQTKIIDFGIAREESGPEDAEGARPGKVSYMSPEQIRGEPVDGRSDIFSLGTILYEITLGRRLWRGPRETVMRRIVEEKPPPPTYVKRDYPPALELIVLRALEKRREDRYPSAGDMYADLEAFLVEIGSRTRDHHVAQVLHELFDPDAPVTELGIRRARAFLEDEGEGEIETLDLDRPAGAALAGALRATDAVRGVTRLPVAEAPGGATHGSDSANAAPGAAEGTATTAAGSGGDGGAAPHDDPRPAGAALGGLFSLVVASAAAAVVWLLLHR